LIWHWDIALIIANTQRDAGKAVKDKDLGANQCQCLERQKFYEEVARILEGHFLDFLNRLSLVQIKVSL